MEWWGYILLVVGPPALVGLLFLVLAVVMDPPEEWRGTHHLSAKGLLVSLALAAACGAGFLLSGCGQRDIPSSEARPRYTAWIAATGRSMLPTYPESSLVEVEVGVPFTQLAPGDTVVLWDYTRPGESRFILHRLVARQGGNWIAQGDNPVTNPRADRPWVTPDNYVARATGRHTQLLVAPSLP